MTLPVDEILHFLKSVHPYDSLTAETLDDLAQKFKVLSVSEGQSIHTFGEPMLGLYLLHDGEVEVRDGNGSPVSLLSPRNSFGERGLIRDGKAVTSARAATDSVLLMLPRADFDALMTTEPTFSKFFDRRRNDARRGSDLATSRVQTFMAKTPVICSLQTDVQQTARLMHDHHISSLCIMDGDSLAGIVTTRDLTGKVLAPGLPCTTAVEDVMTRDPLVLSPSAIGSDVLHAMMEHRIGHIPILEAGKLVGIVTQTDLTRFQAVSSAELVSAIARADTAEDMARVTAEIPRLLVQLVAGGNRHEVVTRLITDIADTATRRLLKLAEAKFGPPPVPYLWLACGSQGRQEQTGVSDQDNCLILDDAVTKEQMPYFSNLAKFVSDGLDTCGYFYCPGDMMATNTRWCQPARVWRQYFQGWIARPDPEAQMLASVMFDLRAIGGDKSLFDGLQKDTLQVASRNSIFVAHMITNSLKHTPPLGLLRGFATIRSGEHRNTIDLKLNGVVPVVDLGRIYALKGELTEVNTRSRLQAAEAAGVLSASGGRDLLDAYDLIAESRLNHQLVRINAGDAPDNFMPPTILSDFERSHLRDAFVVIKTMQSSVGQGRGMLS